MGRRDAARRLAEDVRRRLAPLERMIPIRLPGGPGSADVDPAQAQAPEPARAATRSEPDAEQAVARIDAARVRLRASIDPPSDDL